MLFILLISNLFAASDNFNFSLGPNFSKFLNDEDAESYQGYTFGLRYELFFEKQWSISGGIFYSKEGSELKNKISRVKTRWDTSYYYLDIHSVAGYLIFPINIGYSFFYADHAELKVFAGFSFLFPIKEFIRKENVKPIFNNNEIQHEYDSLGQEDSIFKIGENTNFSLDFGIKQKYKRYFVDFCINYHLKEFGRFDNISKIKKQLFTVRILLGVTL